MYYFNRLLNMISSKRAEMLIKLILLHTFGETAETFNTELFVVLLISFFSSNKICAK